MRVTLRQEGCLFLNNKAAGFRWVSRIHILLQLAALAQKRCTSPTEPRGLVVSFSCQVPFRDRVAP